MHPQQRKGINDHIRIVGQRPDGGHSASRIEKLLHRPIFGLQPGDHAVLVLDFVVTHFIARIQAGSKLVWIVRHNSEVRVCVAFVIDSHGFVDDVELVEVAQYSFDVCQVRKSLWCRRR